MRNKLVRLEATLFRNYDRVTGVKCSATIIAEKAMIMRTRM